MSYHPFLHISGHQYIRSKMKTESSFAPAATMFYTDLEKLRGLKSPVDYGSGIEYANGIKDSLFPMTNVGLQVRFERVNTLLMSFCVFNRNISID